MPRRTRSPDPRSGRTIGRLQQALVAAAREKPVAEIQVTELCAAAGVHRTTFYKHFDTVSHLARTMTKEVLSRLERPGAPEREPGIRGWLVELLRDVAASRDRLAGILGPTGDATLRAEVCEKLVARAQDAVERTERRGVALPMEGRTFATAVGFGAFGLVQAVLADPQIDVVATSESFVAQLPAELVGAG